MFFIDDNVLAESLGDAGKLCLTGDGGQREANGGEDKRLDHFGFFVGAD